MHSKAALISHIVNLVRTSRWTGEAKGSNRPLSGGTRLAILCRRAILVPGLNAKSAT